MLRPVQDHLWTTRSSVGGRSLPFPSLARVRYLSFYPLMLAARAVSARRHMRGGVIGVAGRRSEVPRSDLSAGGRAQPGAGLRHRGRRVTGQSSGGRQPAARRRCHNRRLGDVRMGGRCGVLGAGFLIFAAAAVTYGLQVTAGTYVLGTSLDARQAIGVAFRAMCVDRIPCTASAR
jgi:hypothetical protein